MASTSVIATPFSDAELHALRQQFPILQRRIKGNPLVYLDSGASAQRPQAVMDAMHSYAANHHANVHRGVHTLSQEASALYEDARAALATFLGAQAHQVVFTKGTTESINLVAHGLAEVLLQKDDEIVLTHLEHHSNILPWQEAARRSGARLRVIPVEADGTISLEKVSACITTRTRVLAFAHVSNTLGTILPLAALVGIAKAVGAVVVLDAAQSAPHMPLRVDELGVDFLAFSGHKVYGPTGIGILYMGGDWPNRLPPYQLGGGIIKEVRFEGTTFAEGPLKFEAGTPPIEAAVGLAAAVKWLEKIDFSRVQAHEQRLLSLLRNALSEIPGIQLLGPGIGQASVQSLLIKNIHPFDLGTLLDQMGFAVRTGHHCTQPLMELFGLPGTVRVSFGVYNTPEETALFAQSLGKAANLLR
jgi:cysteine desulfurase/selenocysteine lyase